MSMSICSSCFARLRLAAFPGISEAAISIPARPSFHTSAHHQNVVKKKTVVQAGTRAKKLRESTGPKLKKTKRERARPPPVGERKALRKRIVLSNTNALDLSQIEKMSTQNMADSGKIGQILALDGELLDQLRDAKAFKTSQNWAMFRTPSTLIREETIGLGKDVEEVNNSLKSGGETAQTPNPRTIQRIVAGSKACGKSIHLLQAMSMAYMNDWVVINVPDARDFVMNSSAYAPAATKGNETKSSMYIQPQLTSELLGRIAHSNSAVLSKLKPVHSHEDMPRSISKMKSLHELAMLGAEEPSVSTSLWEALWKELTATYQDAGTKGKRPPLLIAVDGVDHWMGPSKYRSAEFDVIHAHQFTLVQHFLNFLFSEKKDSLPNGGIVIAATTGSNNPVWPTFEVLLQQIEARRTMEVTDSNFPMPSPFEKVDQRVFDLLRGTAHLGLVPLKGLSKPESWGLLDYFARSGLFREAVTESTVGEKWSMSGGGIIGELCKLGSRVRVGELETRKNQSTKVRG